MKKIVYITLSTILLSACVSSSKYNQLMKDYSNTSQELDKNKIALSEASTALSALKDDLDKCQQDKQSLNSSNEQLQKDAQISSREITELNKQLQNSNSKINEVLNDKSKHLTELSGSLGQKEHELMVKERNLDSLQREIKSSQNQIKKMRAQLEASNKQLTDIHEKLKKALLGFTGKGLSIENKNGKIYVSMEEKLLFSSGSWEVSKDGEAALGEIAVVLGNNKDIDIMIEGHTDNVPLKGKNQIKDNWDLSVMRATSITKILLNGTGISPKRIVPCGRGEYMPVSDNKTEEHRAKNRRTEIILSPKVDELLNILKQ